ncbi:molybdate ABC transporter substrate-binding protein [Desulfovibrio mangrovi]|uniref:molybdate ABC transporter substrate-binding protein n=1 Tax=Desulfovibrio mangrovi TaxID=2976983 RepID=UPI0022451718|nr:molybdate ABC transporter substrate-binding protein [Desulfovibrio mangrovi]UZP68751.1 molybdate ABC transporter substrate-binding protein [Desulfovibrio mangrovi]
MYFAKSCFLAILMSFVLCSASAAAELSVACAANFTAPMKELAAMYEKETGTRVLCTFGSTSMLYGQITNGAPYDLFFAADEATPELLHETGIAQPCELYAKGRVILWSARAELASLSDWRDVVLSENVRKIGLANPKAAPYGRLAEEALRRQGLLERVAEKLVFGKNVSAAFQYAYSQGTDVSFGALSQALSGSGAEGVYWPVPEAEPVRQGACVLSSGHADEARSFLAWFATPSARAVIGRYGYE